MRPLPVPTPETQFFWDKAALRQLWIMRCTSCAWNYFYPRTRCPRCYSEDTTWMQASGRGTLYSYVINHRDAPGFSAPYVIGVVELEEGPRMMSNIVGVEPTPEKLPIDLPLTVLFEDLGDFKLPVFEPMVTDR